MPRREGRVVLPFAEWGELKRRERREIRRYARRGMAHPDLYLAALGHAWARGILAEPLPASRAKRGAEAVVDVGVFAAIAALLGPVAAGASFDTHGWADRRLARRLVRVSAGGSGSTEAE